MTDRADIQALRNHPAARHWAALGMPGEPDSLEVLQDESTRAVYRLGISAPPRQRLAGMAPEAAGVDAVIAKRAPREDIDKESGFYASLLPRLEIRGLETFGVIEDDDPAYGWIYLTDAGDRAYNPDKREHRILAAEWLAKLHIEGSRQSRPRNLDDRGPAHFLPFVHKALRTLEAYRDERALGDEDRALLIDILEFCRRLESNWPEIKRFCDQFPQTLVHGDIKEDNMRIVGGNQLALLVFDWHEGGWGAPALDLAKFLGYRVAPDFDTYLRHWLEAWPEHGIGAVRRLGYVGEIFRWVASVRWHLDDLGYGNSERALARMRVYREWMAEIELAAPWRDNSALRSATWQPREKSWI